MGEILDSVSAKGGLFLDGSPINQAVEPVQLRNAASNWPLPWARTASSWADSEGPTAAFSWSIWALNELREATRAAQRSRELSVVEVLVNGVLVDDVVAGIDVLVDEVLVEVVAGTDVLVDVVLVDVVLVDVVLVDVVLVDVVVGTVVDVVEVTVVVVGENNCVHTEGGPPAKVKPWHAANCSLKLLE